MSMYHAKYLCSCRMVKCMTHIGFRKEYLYLSEDTPHPTVGEAAIWVEHFVPANRFLRRCNDTEYRFMLGEN